MDVIFEEDMDEVGSDVAAYRAKCKADAGHAVITKYEEEVRRVQCSPCGDVHAYRKPRGEGDEEAAPPEEDLKSSKKRTLKKPTWEEFFKKHDADSGRPYTFRDTYYEGDVVTHPKFGVGFASEIMGDDKVELTFED